MKTIYHPLFLLLGIFNFISCDPYVLITQEGDWTSENQLAGPVRCEAVSFVIGHFAYVGTGWNGLNTWYKDFWKYDPANKTWSQITDMPGAARNSAFAFNINGKGYVGTGFDGTQMLKDFYELDTMGNVWSKKSDFPGGKRSEAVAFGIDNYGYAGTGFDGIEAQKDFYRYDPDKDFWSDLGFSGNKRFGALAFTYQNKAYVVTGQNDSIMQTDFWRFDPEGQKGRWTELRQIKNSSTDTYDDNYYTIPRANGSAFVIPPYAYISTGDHAGYNAHTWQYDFVNDQWNEKTAFEGPRTTSAVGFSLPSSAGGGGYIATGKNAPGPSGTSDRLWQFFPQLGKNPENN